jgi:uncharacterized protein (DUF488 family)
MRHVWTIGHSTRGIDHFIAALQEHGIKMLVDVRLLPGSKRHPQFNKDALAKSLGERGIHYEHFPELGGRRRPRTDSPNTAWRNASFRGYADYMEGGEFRAGIDRLVDVADQFGPTAMMCAEALWWRCHRALISDFLKAREVTVTHIIEAGKSERHRFTSAARVVDGKLSYRPRTHGELGLDMDGGTS